MLQAVDPDSPAEKAGLRAGDLITAVDGASVDENHSLSDLIRAKKPGEKVTLSVLRGTRTLTLDATLGSRKLDTGQEVASLGVTYVSWPPVGPTD
jgi:S1-C subfamily serine protease